MSMNIFLNPVYLVVLPLISKAMVVITREQAICTFYCKEYNEKNVTKLTKIIDSVKNVDICYLENPFMPILCSFETMRANQDTITILQ